MYDIKKILVPTDFSPFASDAYTPARELAEKYGALVDYIHVIPTLHYFHESMDTLNIPLSLEKNVYPQVQKEAAGKLRELMEQHLKASNRGDAIVTIARKPSLEIANRAQKGGYDLIIMAAQGKHETSFLRGSTTEKVIRHSEVPVLSTQDPDIMEVGNILLPTDGSQMSLRAFPMALSLALTFGASITLFHVLELHGSLTESEPRDPRKSDMENIRSVLLKSLQQYFDDATVDVSIRSGEDEELQLVYSEGASSATINLDIVIEKAVSAHYAITDYANDNAGMVVMTTHGRSGIAHLMLGSTAEKVSQYLDLPVITVKPDFESR